MAFLQCVKALLVLEGTEREDADPEGGQRPAAASPSSPPQPHWGDVNGTGGVCVCVCVWGPCNCMQGRYTWVREGCCCEWDGGVCVHAHMQGRNGVCGIAAHGPDACACRSVCAHQGGNRMGAGVCVHACSGGGGVLHSCMGACGAGDVPHGWVWVVVGAGTTLQEGSLLLPLRLAAAHGPKITALQEVLGVLGGEQRQGGVVVIKAKVLPRRGVSGGVLLP